MELTTDDQRVLRDLLEERKAQLEDERQGVEEGIADLKSGNIHVYENREELIDELERLAQNIA